MTQIVRPNDGYFAALHGAFWQGGTFVYVPRGVEVPLPLRAATWLKQSPRSIPAHADHPGSRRARRVHRRISPRPRTIDRRSTTARSKSSSATARSWTT